MQSPSSPESPAQATLDSAQKRGRQAKKSTRGKDVEQNNMKRNKTTRACDECRKRKVKCDGEQPCEKCRKADTPCVYAKLPPKRGPPKQYMEVLEARLRLVEKALRRIDGTAGKILDEAFESSQSQEGDEPMDTTIMKEESVELSSAAAPSSPNPTNEGDRFCINEIGQAMYVNDIKANIDRMSSMQTDFKGPPFAQPSSQSFQTDNDVEQFMDSDMDVPLAGLPSDAPLSLIKTYFKHVHRYVPMLYQPFFYKQLGSKDNPPSPLLIYAMCAVASRWATDQENAAGGASGSGAPMPPGFQYYQRAFALIDEYSDAPRIQTIQALLLLTKYQEYYRRLGFFHRPGLYLGMAVRMCSDLGLPKLKYRSEHPHDAETKKRTFWMIFMYDLMMSIEQGREPCLSKIECTADYPLFTNEENPTVEELLLHHNTLIQLCKILSDIYLLSRRIATRQHQQGDHRSLQQAVEEHGRLFLLNTHLENFLHELPATLAYPPSQDSQSYPADKHSINDHFVGFLHMTFHFSIILLHRHYVQHPLPKDQVEIEPYEHKQYCLASASHITNIAETMLDSQPMEVFNYPFRGVQHSIHCLTMAATVHRDEMLMNPENEAAKQQYLKTLNILNRLASESPAVEFHSHIKEAELAQMYGRLAVDSSRTSPVHSSARSTSSSSTDGTVAATNDRVSISDASSTSSSPVMSSSADMSRPARAIKLPKSRRHTMTAPSSTGSQLMQIAKQTPVQRQPHMPYQMDQSFLLNSSATFTDPARFATMMMQSGNSMHLYNHHQQPISCAPPQQPFHQPFSPSPAYLQRKSRLGHHSSYSQEDLRSLRRAHMNKPISGGNWPPAQTRSPAQTSDFPYSEQQPNRMTRQLRRQSSMTAMMPSYYAQRQQQQQLMPPQLATPRQQTMQAPPFPMEHHRRHTISNPGTGPVYPVTTIPTPDQVIQQQQQQPPQQPFVQSNMYYDMNLDKFNELSYQDVSMTTTPDTQTMMLDPPSLPADDTVLMNELLNDQAQWPIMTNASGYEDMQRSEGHVM